MRMYGRLSAIEDEWHIRGIPAWLDPLYTFQRTWFPDDVQASDTFNPTVAKALALIGGGLLGYYVWDRTKNRAYTGLAGAAGFVVSPMLLAVYDRYAVGADEESDGASEGGPTNTWTQEDIARGAAPDPAADRARADCQAFCAKPENASECLPGGGGFCSDWMAQAQAQTPTTYQLMPMQTAATQTARMVIAKRDPQYDLI